MAEKMKTDVGRLHLVFIIILKNSIVFVKLKLFVFLQSKSCLSLSVFILSIISQILKTKFYVIWSKTCRNLKSIHFFKVKVA